jgi:pimeloyl-ACP methyl ester carboxylesterase
MPFATNDGVRIRYEVEGSGPPLLLHIGYFLGMEDWAVEGYVAALADRYRLVMLDPRGQGRSDAPHTPGAYTLDNRVRDVLAVLDAAGIEKTLFLGVFHGRQYWIRARSVRSRSPRIACNWWRPTVCWKSTNT